MRVRGLSSRGVLRSAAIRLCVELIFCPVTADLSIATPLRLVVYLMVIIYYYVFRVDASTADISVNVTIMLFITVTDINCYSCYLVNGNQNRNLLW